MSAEKRKFARVNYPCAVTVWHNDEVIMANTANISAGGLCVFLNQAISTGSLMEIKIDTQDDSALNCFAEVVRCREDSTHRSSKQKFYETAVQFSAVDDKDRQELENFVQKLIESQRVKPRNEGS